jgi:helicase MOV-10
VAVTRAQSLLIIVGDPQVLSLDPLWRAFLNYVYLNGGWTGLPNITWDPENEVDHHDEVGRGGGRGYYVKRAWESAQFDMIEFTRRMEAVTLDEVDEQLLFLDGK